MDIQRRRFLQIGLIGGAVLATVRVAYDPPNPASERAAGDYAYQFLNATERAMFAALIPVVLDGALPAGRPELIDRVLQALDRSLQSPAPAVQKELRDLFNLLAFPLTRRTLAGLWAPWHAAGRDDIARFLERWRDNRFALFNSAHVGLITLIKCAWYGLPEAFAEIGYPGPPEIAVQQLLGGRPW